MTGRLSSQRLLDKLSEAACSRSRSPQGLPESNRGILDELSQLLPILMNTGENPDRTNILKHPNRTDT